MVIKQLNPNNVFLWGKKIDALPNGTILLTGGEDFFTALYPNGGFEQAKRTPEEFWDERIYPVVLPSGVKAVKKTAQWGESQPWGREREYTLSVCDFRIGTSYGSWTLSEPQASISTGMFVPGYSNEPYWVSDMEYNDCNSLHETASGYLVGNLFIQNKQNAQLQPLTKEQSEKVILPSYRNIYKNKTWAVGIYETECEVQSFDMENLSGENTRYDFSRHIGQFLKTSSCTNIPGGEVTVSGVRYSDGKQVVLTLKIDTGEITCTETDDQREITTLIPMN